MVCPWLSHLILSEQINEIQIYIYSVLSSFNRCVQSLLIKGAQYLDVVNGEFLSSLEALGLHKNYN